MTTVSTADRLSDLVGCVTGYEMGTVRLFAPKPGAVAWFADAREFLTNGVTFEPCLVRFYAIADHPTRIVVPDDYARELDAVRAMRLRLEGTPHDCDVPLSPGLANRALPEDCIPHLKALPRDVLPDTLQLLNDDNPVDVWHRQTLGDSTFRSQAAATPNTITFYCKDLDEFLGDEIRHEWAHLAKWEMPTIGQVFDAAARFEGFSIVHRERALVDADEDWAVHLGEQLLHPDPDVFFELTRDNPIRTVFLGEALRRLYQPPCRTGSTFDEQLADRLAYIDTAIRPGVVAHVTEEARTSPDADRRNDAARLLVHSGDATDLARAELTTLNLRGEPIGRTTLLRLRDCKTLIELDLSRTWAGPGGLSDLGGLPLRRLRLSGTSMPYGSVDDLLQMVTLEHLDLSYANLSEPAVFQLREMTFLHTLDLTGVRHADMIDWLRAHMPTTEIIG